MKASSVKYEHLYSLGNFEHAKYGVELVVEEGEKAADVMEAAKKFVRQMNTERMTDEKRRYDAAQRVLADRDNRLVREVDEAQRTIAEFEAQSQDETPF